jgi:hypothetical protein
MEEKWQQSNLSNSGGKLNQLRGEGLAKETMFTPTAAVCRTMTS